uniref:uncharacterized protein n=1 Tax=Semicossyphus pulcher TaxID=241346 RepID=UPI0037E85EDB
MKPIDVSRPAQKKCSVIFTTLKEKSGEVFQTVSEFFIDLTCDSTKQILNISSYKPSCHIKLDHPPQPEIIETNSTTVSWIPPGTKRYRIKCFNFQLQWKQDDQSWRDAVEKKKQYVEKQCQWNCTTKLHLLIRGERYEARVRVKAVADDTHSIWSDWSPTVSWESSVGGAKQSSGKEGSGVVISGVVACVVLLVLLPAVIFLTAKNTIWIVLVKRIKGPPLPNPAKSFLKDVNFQNWLSPHFSTIFKPLDITSVEIASPVDVVALCRPEEALAEKMKSKSSFESNSNSGFSNPSYAHLCHARPPPAVLLTSGNLDPCAADTPYGPVCSQSKDKDAEQESEEVRGTGMAILQLLSKGSNNSKLVPVISDYEKVEKLQLERSRLQSLDSGVCSGEEVSQESVEADSINVTDEGPLEKEERKGGDTKEVDFQKLFGGAGDIFGKGSIQVCSDYERVQNLQPDSPELQSLDLGISSGDEEQFSHEESLEDVDKSTEFTTLLFPPPSSILQCSFSPVTPLSLNFAGPAFRPAPRPLTGHILERIALMSTSSSVEPPADGYMPVRQEQS